MLTPQQFEMISIVMYEPLQYIHQDYYQLATPNDDTIWQKLSNRQLIQQYRLETEIDFDLENDPVVSKLITQWSHFPQCALFLGYFFSSSALLQADNYYELPPSLHAFLSLKPIVLADEKIDNIIGEPQDIGYQLLFDFISSISNPLAQRFVLCFPKAKKHPTLPAKLHLSCSLFLLVLNYVAISA